MFITASLVEMAIVGNDVPCYRGNDLISWFVEYLSCVQKVGESLLEAGGFVSINFPILLLGEL